MSTGQTGGQDSLSAFPIRGGRCDACDGPLDANYAAAEDGAFVVCSACDDAARAQGGGSCTADPDYVCTGWCSECEVNS